MKSEFVTTTRNISPPSTPSDTAAPKASVAHTSCTAKSVCSLCSLSLSLCSLFSSQQDPKKKCDDARPEHGWAPVWDKASMVMLAFSPWLSLKTHLGHVDMNCLELRQRETLIDRFPKSSGVRTWNCEVLCRGTGFPECLYTLSSQVRREQHRGGYCGAPLPSVSRLRRSLPRRCFRCPVL